MVVDQPADDLDGLAQVVALRRAKVDAREHEVAQLVHGGQDRVVHADLAHDDGVAR